MMRWVNEVWFLGLTLMVSVITAAGCRQPESNQDERPLQVVASFSIPADWAKAVLGPEATITTLVGPNGDPHVYTATPGDLQALARADLIIMHGLGLEDPWLLPAVAAAQSRGKLLNLSEGITPIEIITDHGRELDPHTWHDPAMAKPMIQRIALAAQELKPEQSQQYQARLESYFIELTKLEEWTEVQLKNLPPTRRLLVTNHDTFGYFAKRYQFQIIGTALNSATTDTAEPSAGELAKLVETIRQAKVPAIFCDASHQSKLIERIASQAGVQVAPALYTDGLGPDGSPASTYLGMLQQNLVTILKALSSPQP